MPETLFAELKRYVGFSEVDEKALRRLHPIAQPFFQPFAEEFYQRILEHDGARASLVGGESVVGHLKITLQGWMNRLLEGPWDEAYFDLRCRIGRLHVRIALPQHYMFGAMNVVRGQMTDLIDRTMSNQPEALVITHRAMGKILDLELAIMLHTYREELLAQQSRQERLATFGQLVGSMGHELRNPLGVMESSLYILKGRIGDDERALKHVERIGGQISIANQIVSDLLDMIRDRPQANEKISLHTVLAEAVEVVSRPESVTLVIEGIDALPHVIGDHGQLRQLVINLLENAVQAMGTHGAITVTGSQEGERLQLSVQDTGPGVDPVTRLRLFEPLVTTKEKGVGLGLALVKRIAERHGGKIEYAPGSTGGARFVLHLPVAAP